MRLWLEGRPITARRVSPTGHAWRLCRRHPAVAGLLLTLAITLASGAVGLFVLLNEVAAKRSRLAEALRNAKAYEKFSASAADQLGLLLQTSIRHKRATTQDQMRVSLSRLRNATNDLRNRKIVPSSTLGILEEEIGWALMSLGTNEEARELLNQAVADLKQSLAKNPDDKEARYHLGDALVQTGQLAYGDGKLEDALNCYEQASAIQMNSEPSESTYNSLTFLYKRLQDLADRLGQGGRTGQKDRSVRLSEQILRHLIGSDFARSTDPPVPGPDTLGRLFHRDDVKAMSSHADSGVRRSHEYFVSQWLAVSVEPFSPFRSSSVAASYDRDPEAGAGALIYTLRKQCSKFGLADSMVPAAVFTLTNDAAGQAGEQRKVGRLDDARATIARLMALARRLVREYPDSANSDLVLSIAHDQVKRNAFEADDDNLVLEALVHAVEAGQWALTLDPDSLETRRHLNKLTKQLASVKADRNAVVTSVP